MKYLPQIIGLTMLACGLSACQSTALPYNGVTGFVINAQTQDTATLTYTLATGKNQSVDAKRLQAACQQVLNKTKTYQLQIIDSQNINNPYPTQTQTMQTVPVIGAKMGFSNTPNLYNSEAYATQTALDARPSTLSVVQYRCS